MKQIKQLLEHEKIRSAFAFIQEQDRELSIKQQIELVSIPAPSRQEAKKSKRFAEMLGEIGLGEVVTDSANNSYVRIKGSVGRPKLVVTAHCDTVFPAETDLTIRYEENGRICAPGICDDTRGMADILSVCRAIGYAKILPVGDMLIGCDAGEESLGDLYGIKQLLTDHIDADGFVSVDCPILGQVVHAATGGIKYRVTFLGEGGHSFGAYGTPNPGVAMCKVGARLSELELAKAPKTTMNLGTFGGGTSVNAIPTKTEMTIDLRSNSQNELERLHEQFLSILEQAVAEESARDPQKPVTYQLELLSARPAGSQSVDSPIVATALEVLKAMGVEYSPRPEGAGSTDSNWAIHLGIPAVTIARGGNGGLSHTVNEWFSPEDEFLGPQQTLLTIMALAGMTGVTEPVLPLREAEGSPS